mmetsp:Transcript_14651/g.51475  ORF Transcript_14651/g.51475 Transcript_14651/m.51475 type:complete len:218 (-) Transcript_14651:582-1235(-)
MQLALRLLPLLSQLLLLGTEGHHVAPGLLHEALGVPLRRGQRRGLPVTLPEGAPQLLQLVLRAAVGRALLQGLLQIVHRMPLHFRLVPCVVLSLFVMGAQMLELVKLLLRSRQFLPGLLLLRSIHLSRSLRLGRSLLVGLQQLAQLRCLLLPPPGIAQSGFRVALPRAQLGLQLIVLESEAARVQADLAILRAHRPLVRVAQPCLVCRYELAPRTSQ